jgi:hypothetical protein
MKIEVEDWNFRNEKSARRMVAVDLFLGNGQRAVLEILPLYNPCSPEAQVPEVVVRCEMPGEKINQTSERRRWLSRAPDKSCEWSSVELTDTLVRQINEKLEGLLAEPQEAVAA